MSTDEQVEQTPFDVLYEAYLHQKEVSNKAYQRSLELFERIKQHCTHTETEVYQHYSPGTYYDKAEYLSITKCAKYHKELDAQREVGYYG